MGKFYLIDYARKLIKEEIGSIMDIHSLIDNAIQNIENEINLKREDIKSKNIESYPLSFIGENIKIKDLFFHSIKIKILFLKNKNKQENYLNGSFIEKQFGQVTDENKTKYNCKIEIYIYNWDFKKNINKQIATILTHELHHAFTEAKKLNKKSKSNKLNSVSKQMKQLNQTLNENYWQFKEFCNVFYLNLPEERNAKIHELYQEAKTLKGKPKDFIIKEMSKFSAFKDFRKMKNFIEIDFSNIPLEDKKQFVRNFFTSLIYQRKYFNKNLINIKYENNPDMFFKYWASEFNKNANNLLKKTNKIINYLNHETINESDEIFDNSLNPESFYYIFGIEL
jgi:hypothetical protein